MNGQKIKVLRVQAGMTQTALAKALGVSQQAVGQWETGDGLPRAELLPKLAKLLKCTIDDLFDLSDA